MGLLATANSRASAARRTLGASSRLSTRRASRIVHNTCGWGQVISHRLAAARRNPISNPALWATSTESPANSKNIGRTASIVGALPTIAVVIPVSRTIWGGMLCCGFTRVANSPSTAPPHTLTAPISVIASGGVASLPVVRPPVVSRSTTTKVVSRRDISSAGVQAAPWACARSAKLS
ncbi:Uncharacterised protein [Mycobacterium tuberculosis]|uniref:Uncharacterized protein n=1 Tax=Mycobacterium tuberculosis TaxID=1773 RepID=A0A0T9FUR5_MYCTX|nr:Uncharacterised protein [Mycobacterium tuberculosis]CFE60541.1 Uncharacterised protein [Mycobacterium tuberculosis]CFS02128.1 Uncharacterised protein [Mycobacterium tuberculosis]CKO86636.1 Uncharacterised protein [Mycobacterium tuberculosis]CKR56743.1 Uncharacterised protein [Mycobacterium tuberculosis]